MVSSEALSLVCGAVLVAILVAIPPAAVGIFALWDRSLAVEIVSFWVSWAIEVILSTLLAVRRAALSTIALSMGLELGVLLVVISVHVSTLKLLHALEFLEKLEFFELFLLIFL